MQGFLVRAPQGDRVVLGFIALWIPACLLIAQMFTSNPFISTIFLLGQAGVVVHTRWEATYVWFQGDWVVMRSWWRIRTAHVSDVYRVECQEGGYLLRVISTAGGKVELGFGAFTWRKSKRPNWQSISAGIERACPELKGCVDVLSKGEWGYLGWPPFGAGETRLAPPTALEIVWGSLTVITLGLGFLFGWLSRLAL